MTPNDLIVHERMLGGAIDSFTGHIAHTRPFLLADYREALERMAEQWLDQGHPNALDAIDSAWIAAYLATTEEPELTRTAIKELYQWAIEQHLVDANPLT
jgi:site-specific recombinase XerD